MMFIGQTPEDHFDKSVELELELESKGKYELLAEVRAISDMVNIHYIEEQPLLAADDGGL